MAIYRDGKRLEGDEASKAMKTHMARFNPSGSGSPQEAKRSGGSSGKGGGEPAKPKYDPKSKDFANVLKKYNEDGKFGYGYVDANTGIEVPWYIDMINGGGANAAGPEFISPFADAPMGGGMAGIASQGVTGIANALPFVTPYGSEQARPYAQAGMVGYDHLSPKPAPLGRGSPTVTPEPIAAPTQDFSNVSNAPAIRSGLIGYNPQVVAGTPRPSPTDTAMTTPSMDQMWNIATQTVMRRFPTMPEAERQAAIQGEYQRLVNAIGM